MITQPAAVDSEEANPAQTGVSPVVRLLSGRSGLLILLGLSLAGILLVLLNTRWGPYLSDDSYFYIYPARDYLAGKGFHPSYIFAPLFPLLLAGIANFGPDPVIAARWLNAVLFGINIFLVGQVTRRAGAPPVFALLTAALVLLSDVTAEAHGWAMSEALAFTFMLLGLDFTLRYLYIGRQRWWWLAAAAAALTVLTRYAAVPLIAAIALTLLFYAPLKSLMHRFWGSTGFGLASLTPIAAYWLRNQQTAGQMTRYEGLLIEPISRDQITWFLYHWFSLFVPGRLLRDREILAGIAITSLVLAAGMWVAIAYRKQWSAAKTPLFQPAVFLFTAVLGMNLIMLVVARGLKGLDVYNPRYLVPLLIVFLILLSTLAGQGWRVAGRWTRAAGVVLFILFFVYYGVRSVDFSRDMLRMGLGYSNIGWHNSETVAYLHAHPELENIVSTGEMGIYFWTGRKPRVLAEFSTSQALHDYLCAKAGTLFIMQQMPAEIYGMSHADAVRELEIVQTFNDSEMYRCASNR